MTYQNVKLHILLQKLAESKQPIVLDFQIYRD